MRPSAIAWLALAVACRRPDTDAPDSGPEPGTDAPDTDTDAPPYVAAHEVVQVPCDSVGPAGLAVRIGGPDAPRYAEGAPVVIRVPGFFDTGVSTFAETTGWTPQGAVDLAWLMPGGYTPDHASGGVFDDRGQASVRALACVAAFAAGDVATTDDRLLRDIVGAPLLEVGIVADSNGGNLAVAALAAQPDVMHGVRWLLVRETPAGDHFVLPLLGLGDRANPTYVAGSCAPEACTTDLAALRISDQTYDWKLFGRPGVDLPVRAVFYDLDGDDLFDDGGLGEGAEYDDLYEASADLPVFPWLALDGETPLAYYPIEATEALEAALGAEALTAAGIATEAQARAFWRWRDPFGHGDVAVASAALPDLAVILLATADDHVQAAADHPHIAIQLAAWQTSFVRLGPDAAYSPVAIPEVPAGTVPEGQALLDALIPESVPERILAEAAVAELMDRARYGVWAPDLGAKLPY